MTRNDSAKIRLKNQLLVDKTFNEAKDIVQWMCAMQAQDFPMSMWAVGIRHKNTTLDAVQKAFNSGEILRTHVLRPTWHLVSPDDISWMLELTAPNIKNLTRARDYGLGIDETIINYCNSILEKELRDGNHLTAEELKFVFKNLKIDTDENRFYHIMMHAELDGIVCSGAIKNKKQSYALLSERITTVPKLTRDEALAKLAFKYISSHGPVCLKDFAWWSGLSVGDSRKAIEMVKQHFVTEVIENETYWFFETTIPNRSDSIHFIPAFDETIISYRNRNAVLMPEHQPKAYTSNGIFKPVVMINGEGSGIWKRTIKKDSVHIEIDHFINHNLPNIAFEKAIEKYGTFLGLKAIIK